MAAERLEGDHRVRAPDSVELRQRPGDQLRKIVGLTDRPPKSGTITKFITIQTVAPSRAPTTTFPPTESTMARNPANVRNAT